VPITVTPAEASDAGQATIEHAETLFEETFSTNVVRRGHADAACHLYLAARPS
jgi:hypothetical protein